MTPGWPLGPHARSGATRAKPLKAMRLLQMQLKENSDVWQTTLTLPPESEFTYKFRNGYWPDTWAGGWEMPGSECATGDYFDRYLSLGLNDTTLTAVCFSECILCD